MKRLLVLVCVVTVAACTREGSTTTPAAPVRNVAAPQVADAFGENSMIEFGPADTPYAFASFKPIPIAVMRKLFALNNASLKKALAVFGDSPIAMAMAEGIGSITLDNFDAVGLTAEARFAVYGLGAWPVVHVEIASGDRFYANVKQRVAAAGVATLPEPTVRGDRRFWIFPSGHNVIFAALAPRELVVAYAPRAVVDANLPALVGETRPAQHLTAAMFRALAKRDGFTGQGVGFADFARIVALAGGDQLAAPCRDAIAGEVARAPRIVFGYDDVTLHHMGIGAVLELAPELVAQVHAIETPMPGATDLLATRPIAAAALRVDLEKGRALLARAVGEVGGVVRICGPAVPSFDDAIAWLRAPMAKPLAGLRGAYASIDRMTPLGEGYVPSSGYAHAEYADTSAMIATLAPLVRGLAPDRQPHALPSMLPPGHIAATPTTLALALGDNSAGKVLDVLDGPAAAESAKVPLAMIAMDFSQLGDVLAASKTPGEDPADAARREAVAQTIGLAVIKLMADRRGIAASMIMELR